MIQDYPLKVMSKHVSRITRNDKQKNVNVNAKAGGTIAPPPTIEIAQNALDRRGYNNNVGTDLCSNH